jgi:hypothetical protein
MRMTLSTDYADKTEKSLRNLWMDREVLNVC